MHCTNEEDGWQLQTCQGRTNRMKLLTIYHRHVAIQGMPIVVEENAKLKTQAILGMRGVGQRKTKMAHKEGYLRLKGRLQEH